MSSAARVIPTGGGVAWLRPVQARSQSTSHRFVLLHGMPAPARPLLQPEPAEAFPTPGDSRSVRHFRQGGPFFFPGSFSLSLAAPPPGPPLAKKHGWISNDHFSVDGTLIQAWASITSFKPKGSDRGPGSGNSWTDFKGEKRGNDTHESTTDSEAKLVRKGNGQEARLCFAGHATMEYRNGLCVLFEVRSAVGEPESEVAVDQAVELKNRGFRLKSIGADKGYHTAGFVEGVREHGIKPHPALCDNRDRMGIRRTGAYTASQRIRKRIEEIFGWVKTTGGFRKSRYRGVERSYAAGQYVVAALNLLRMAKLWVTNPPGWARA